jgi:hypothetical protein
MSGDQNCELAISGAGRALAALFNEAVKLAGVLADDLTAYLRR